MPLARRRILQSLVAGVALSGGLAFRTSPARAADEVAALVWQGYDDPAAFKSLAGVALDASYLVANEDVITKTATPGRFDLLTIYQGMIDPLLAVQRIEPIDEERLPNLTGLLPLFLDLDAFKRDYQRYAVPYVWGSMMTLYDSRRVDEPKSFADLMAPGLAGRIGMPDDPYAVITSFARYAGIEDANRLTRAQLDQVIGLLHRFRPQIREITPGYDELPGLYRRGEILASLPDWIPTAIETNKGQRGRIRATVLEEGAFSFVDCWMRVAGARHPDAAYRLLDHAIGSEAQQAIALATGLGIVNQAAVLALDAAVTAPWRYDALDRLFVRAPLYDGVPLEEAGGLTSYRDWTAAWDAFKAG